MLNIIRWMKKQKFPVKICLGQLINTYDSIYHFGGIIKNATSESFEASNLAFKYNFHRDEWEPIQKMPNKRYGFKYFIKRIFLLFIEI